MNILINSVASFIDTIKENIAKIDIAGVGLNMDAESKIIGLINYFTGFLGLVAVVFLIYGGVLYMTASGDEGKVEKATKTIKNALIGLGVVVLSGLIVNFVLSAIIVV